MRAQGFKSSGFRFIGLLNKALGCFQSSRVSTLRASGWKRVPWALGGLTRFRLELRLQGSGLRVFGGL